ncbi:hypothetical protein YPD27_4174 [Yersinia pestis KIM D27]|nr:hypothetical protein YPD27_4174 [Yersinia pestis KIM D27]
MLRRYLFEIIFSTLVICGLVTLFFIYSTNLAAFLQLALFRV